MHLQIAGDERFSKILQTLKQKAKLEEPVRLHPFLSWKWRIFHQKISKIDLKLFGSAVCLSEGVIFTLARREDLHPLPGKSCYLAILVSNYQG